MSIAPWRGVGGLRDEPKELLRMRPMNAACSRRSLSRGMHGAKKLQSETKEEEAWCAIILFALPPY